MLRQGSAAQDVFIDPGELVPNPWTMIKEERPHRGPLPTYIISTE
jgi:hypothetical protein